MTTEVRKTHVLVKRRGGNLSGGDISSMLVFSDTIAFELIWMCHLHEQMSE